MMNRRQFFKSFAIATGAFVVSNTVLKNFINTAAAATVMLDPKDPLANAVKYVKVSKEKGKTCSTCVLYAKTGTEKKKEIGSCSMFAGKSVYGEGYCTAYAPKA
jgi:hypothetical protein